jgi:hypothetical protein
MIHNSSDRGLNFKYHILWKGRKGGDRAHELLVLPRLIVIFKESLRPRLSRMGLASFISILAIIPQRYV